MTFLKELNLTEGRITGIGKILHALKKNDSPEPIFEIDEYRSYFTTKLFIHPEFSHNSGGLNGGINDGLNDGLNTGQQSLLEILLKKQGIRTIKLSQYLNNLPISTIEKQIKKLVKLGEVEYKGSKKDGGYYVINEKNTMKYK